MPVVFDEAADELYGLPPSEFVARRTELAKQARADGDRALAKSVAALRRPTVVAWILNLWSRRHPDEVEAFATLAADLADAQRRAAVDRMRTLSESRQALISAALTTLTALADDNGARLSDAALREAAQTLRAAVADESVSADLRRGRLVTSAEYSGFGPAGLFAVPVAADIPAAPKPAGGGLESESTSAAADIEQLRAAAHAEIEAADAAEHAARHERDRSRQELADLNRRADELSATVERLRAELSRHDAELRFARRHIDSATTTFDEATQALTTAAERTERARAALADLDDPHPRA